MTPDGERTIGELGRAIDTLIDAIRELRAEIAALPSRFVPRETWELSQGANRVDIDRNALAITELEKRMERTELDTNNRVRNWIVVAITAFVSPLVVIAITTAMQR